LSPFWRREKPLHERLADEGGLTSPSDAPHDTMPRWGETGIHGLHRPSKWDAVVAASSDAPGEEIHFVALPDGTLVVEEEVPNAALASLAEAVETTLTAPYRAEAVRRGDDLWAVGASSIRVERLPAEIAGDVVELTVQTGNRTLSVDGAPAFGSVPALEAVAEGMASYVVRARRIDGDLWEVEAAAL
jgi:hypothetical protein